jgi:threonine synthase
VSRVLSLECTRCGALYPAEVPQNVCPKDGGVLFAQYDFKGLKQSFKPESLHGREAGLWRYREVLPDVEPVTLGEGFTPLLSSREFRNVWIKDEGLNPTGSFKARGITVAVSVAKALGLKKLAMPSAGNAGSALAAYAAAAGIEAHIFMPRDVSLANRIECEIYGAKVTLVNGLISDCGRIVSERKEHEGWFDLSTLKEPYRAEGKKTMAYELFEQFENATLNSQCRSERNFRPTRGKLPEAIIFPCGGGVGVIGMWKAFDEMEQLGWIGSDRPRMIAVQAEGCAPLVKAWEEGKSTVESWHNASTIAAGLRVPRPYGDYLVLDILKRSRGTAVAVSDQEIRDAVRHWASTEGIFAAPEGAASLAAYRKLRTQSGEEQRSFLSESDSVVLFNTGTGLKYLDVMQEKKLPASRNIGGIIGPY